MPSILRFALRFQIFTEEFQQRSQTNARQIPIVRIIKQPISTTQLVSILRLELHRGDIGMEFSFSIRRIVDIFASLIPHATHTSLIIFKTVEPHPMNILAGNGLHQTLHIAIISIVRIEKLCVVINVLTDVNG